jgi:hypothetical protein
MVGHATSSSGLLNLVHLSEQNRFTLQHIPPKWQNKLIMQATLKSCKLESSTYDVDLINGVLWDWGDYLSQF